MKHWTRFIGGLGSVSLIYLPLRILEAYPAAIFILVFGLLAYGLGFLLDRDERDVVELENIKLRNELRSLLGARWGAKQGCDQNVLDFVRCCQQTLKSNRTLTANEWETHREALGVEHIVDSVRRG